jgi:thiol-disulfide isomerase/thioredoxin
MNLMHGKWVVVFYSQSCPSCRHALPQYEAAARQWNDAGDDRRLALIEVPTYGPSREVLNTAAPVLVVQHGPA